MNLSFGFACKQPLLRLIQFEVKTRGFISGLNFIGHKLPYFSVTFFQDSFLFLVFFFFFMSTKLYNFFSISILLKKRSFSYIKDFNNLSDLPPNLSNCILRRFPKTLEKNWELFQDLICSRQFFFFFFFVLCLRTVWT